MVLWTYSSKRGEFHHFTVTVRVSRISRVGVSVSIRVRFNLCDRVGIGLPDVD